MGEIGKAYKLLKLSAAGVVALFLGIVLIETGDRQSIVSGLGALLAGAGILAFVSYVTFRKAGVADSEGEEAPKAKKQAGLFWLGILLTLAPGLLYLYLRYSMGNFDSTAAAFLGTPILLAGVVCVGAGLWSRTEK